MVFHTPTDAFFEFIKENLNKDPKNLLFASYGKEMGFDTDFAVTQIECRQRGGKKLKHFTSNPQTLFPTLLSYEQASHESVARFHASLIEQDATVLDMTAGLGIDSMAFAQHARKVTACEYDKFKADVLKYNANLLGLSNLTINNIDSIEYIRTLKHKHDIIFIDPARRSAGDRRLYNLHDCTPDILSVMNELLSYCDKVLIKTSPLLDISQTLKDIPSTVKIRAVSVGGECKEVLIEATENGALQSMEATDLTNDGEINYQFIYNPLKENILPKYALEGDLQLGNYLYEPGATVMKVCPWGEMSERYPDLKKFSSSSHLFLSSTLYEKFPGRILKIEQIIDKNSRKTLKGSPANIVTRNYPINSEELRKKLGVKDGGDKFIYGTRIDTKPILISATKVKI